MQIVTKRQILELMALTPNTPENQVILQQLDELAGALNVVEEPYSYTNTLTAAAGGAANGIAAAGVSAPVITPIDASAMFIIENQTYHANVLNAAQTVGTSTCPLVTVMITDSGTSRQWFDNPISIPMIFGDGRQPYILPKPRVVPANSQISVVYTDYDAASGYNLRLAFNGYKMYSLGGRR